MEIHILNPRYKLAVYTLNNTQPINKVGIPYKFIPLYLYTHDNNNLGFISNNQLNTNYSLSFFVDEKTNDNLSSGQKFNIIKNSGIINSINNYEPYIEDTLFLSDIKFKTDDWCAAYARDKNVCFFSLTVLIDTQQPVQL